MVINSEQIAEMEKRYRATFINSLPGYKCLQLVGTISTDGITNLGLFNSIFHVGANPPLLGMVFRPDSPDHDTLDNIKANGQYTLNNVLPDWYERAHLASAKFPSGVSEFEPCGFKKYYQNGFKPPFVSQSSIKIGLELREMIDIEVNNTTIVIGEIVYIILDGDLIEDDGYLDHQRAGTLTVNGLEAYFTTNKLARLSHARPGEKTSESALESSTL